MIFDITKSEYALQSIIELTRVPKAKIIEFSNRHIIREGCSINAMSLDADNFFNEFCLSTDLIDISQIRIAALHYTTNNDNCSSLKNIGLRDLRYILSTDTPLSRFLAERGISFDIKNEKMYVADKEYCIKYNQTDNTPIGFIAYKIYYDFAPTAFLYVRDVTRYLGRVHCHPEFLYNVEQLLGAKYNLLSEWQKLNECYELKFAAPLKILDDCIFDGQYPLKWLINRALSAANDIFDEEFIYIKRGCWVEPKNFISVTHKEQKTWKN